MGATAIGMNTAMKQVLDAQGPKAPVLRRNADSVALMKVAKEFEAFFLTMIFKEMRKSLPGNPVLSGGKGERIFQVQLDQELSNRMSSQGSIGIANMIQEQMSTLLAPKQATVAYATTGEQS